MCFARDEEAKKGYGQTTIITHPLRLRGKSSRGGESLKSTSFLSRSMIIACEGTPSNSMAKQSKEKHTIGCS